MRTLFTSLAVLLASLPLGAATRLTATVAGQVVPVEWAQSSLPIGYRVDQRLINALPGGATMLDRAFATWEAIPNSRVTFRKLAIENNLRAGQDGQSVVTLSDDLFANQKAIALTTTWDVAGKLVESDIQVDATMIASGYNMQHAITHEIGHMLGLDHSASLSSVMYPFVMRGSDAVVLDSDDKTAIAGIYAGSDRELMGGVLQGRVMGDSGGIFAAQVVAVNERGEPIATGLTDSSGEFTLQAMPDGKYRIYAEPLDGPVDVKQLSPFWRQVKVTPFPTEFYQGGLVNVENGRVYGNLVVRTGGPVQINPKWVGVSASGSSDFKLVSTSAPVQSGQTMALAVGGDGIIGGMTTFEVLSPAIKRVSDFRYSSNYVFANFEIAADAPSGAAVIMVTSGNQAAALTGALRVQGSAGRVRSVRR